MNFFKYFLLTFLFPILVFSQVNVINPDVIEGIAYQKNFIKNSSFEKNTSGINTYNDSADSGRDANNFKDGTGGSGSVTCTRSTTAPIADKASLIFSKGASNLSGHGCSIDFSIPLESKGKTLKIEFSYLVNSGTFVAGSKSTNSDVLVYLYDVTNSKIVDSLSNNKLFSISSTVSDKFSATFQSDSSSSNYRLVFHTASTGTTAFSLKIDSVSVSNSVYVFGSPVTDWQSYTPTLGLTTNTTNISGRWRRLGDSIEVQASFELSGTPAAGSSSVSIPSGLTIDTSKLPAGTQSVNEGNGGMFGSGIWEDSGIGYKSLNVSYASSNTVMIHDTDSGSASVLAAAKLASGDAVGVSFQVPILGWSSSVQMSDGYDSRIVSTRVYKNGTQAYSALTKITSWSVDNDKIGMWDGTNHRFNILTPGDYQIYATIYSTAATTANQQLAYKVNGGTTMYFGNSPNTSGTSNSSLTGSDIIPNLKAGDYVEIYGYANASVTLQAGLGNTRVSLSRISGPTTISATDQISASYRSDSSQSLTTGATLKIFGNTNKLKDTHGSWNNTTGTYTCPFPGDYRVSFNFFTADATSTPAEIILRKNTTGVIRAQPKTHGTNQYSWSGSITIPCNANDTLDFFITASAAGTIYNAAVDNWFSIERIK